MFRCPITPVFRSVAVGILAVFQLLGSDHGYSQRVWRIGDGLPNGRVQAISQTMDGYLWIGTSEGLVRFDGLRFVVFDRSNTTAFADDSVLSLFAANDGSLWIGTEGGGLVHYSRKTFARYSSEHGLSNLFVRSIHEDRRGRLWVGTDRGIFLRQAERFVRLDGTPDLPFVNVASIHEEPSGRLLVAGNGLYRIEGTRLIRHLTLRSARAILQQPNDSLWVAAEGGLFALNGNQALKIQQDVTSPTRLVNDRDGNTWIGTAKGLFRAQASRLGKSASSEPFPDNLVLAIYCDRENNIWVGSRDGLTRLSKKVVTTVTAEDKLADQAVFTIYKDRAERLWVVSGDGELYRLLEGRLQRKTVPALPRDVHIRTIYNDRKGCLWIGSANSGFFRSGCGPTAAFNMSSGLRNNNIRAFLEDRAGALWIATGSGVARLKGDRLKVFYTDEGLAYGSVRSLLEDRQGDLWIGTDGGLSHIRGGTFVSDGATRALAGQRIWALHEDSSGAVWVGTRGRGLFRLDSGKVSALGLEAGLPKSIHQILEDTTGNVWMSGPAGVSRAKLQDLNAAADGRREPIEVVSYGAAEGMQSVQMSGGVQPAGAISSTGDVWFASVKGAVSIRTDAAPMTHVPSAFLEDVRIDGQPMDFSEGVRIPAGADRLEIHFTAPNLLSPERIAFWYKLENFDRDWTYAAIGRAASYTSLPPGNYRFRLIARNLAAPDEPSEASVDLTWQPHFAQTPWAWGLGAVSLAAAAWMGFWMYARQTKQRYALLLAERTRLAREMHDTVIQGCVGVSTLLEAAASFEQTNTSVLVDLLNRARSQVRITLEEARQAVWDLRHDSTGVELLDSLPEFARQLSQESGVGIVVDIVGQRIRLEPEVDRNLLAATREAVRNAVAHGKPQQVRVVLTYQPERVRIEVIDDGIGFQADSPRVAAGHYGILGMRERMERLGGSLRLFSNQARGTRVIAELPLGGNRT